MARRMRDVEFLKEQRERCYEEHIAPINLLVDELRRDGSIPYVAPLYGGVNARLLSVLSDPGPKTQQINGGSGFLCMENDDATAENICKLFEDAGIKPDDIVPWNACPWYIHRIPKAADLNEGIDPIKRLIDLLPRLRVVMLHGGSAHNGWKRLTRKYPEILARGFHVIETYHTSRQAFRHPNQKERERRKEHLRQSFHDAVNLLAKY